MSCLWPERKEGPKDMTDYRQAKGQGQCLGHSSSYWGAGRDTRVNRGRTLTKKQEHT